MNDRFGVLLGSLAISLAPLLAGCGSGGGLGDPGSACAPRCPSTILGHDLEAVDLAVDADTVYWTDPHFGAGAGVFKAPRAGGNQSMFAPAGLPVSVIVDADNVYFTDQNGGAIKKAPKAGGKAIALAENESGVGTLALAGTDLFWTTDDGLRTVAVSGGTPKTLAKGVFSGSNFFFRLRVSDSDAVWAVNGDIWRVARTGGDAVIIRSGPGEVFDLAIDGDSVVYAMGGDSADFGIFRVPIDGGTPARGVPASGEIDGISLTASGVFWSDTMGGRIMGPHGPIARTSKPARLLVDGSSLFWIDTDEKAIKAIDP
jgi:hypothetical protein